MEKLMELQVAGGDNPNEHNIRASYTSGLEEIKKDIIQKINHLENKLNKFNIKEGMLDSIIAETHVEMLALKENEFTKRGQKQSILLKQLEALSVLHDTIMKYEDMIQKYRKTLMDIENNKLNAFIKLENLSKEELATENSLSEVLMGLQNMLTSPDNSPAQTSLIAEIEAELHDQNYK